MATRFKLQADSITDATADENTTKIDLTQFAKGSIQVVWTGLSGAPTIRPDVSNDGTNWLCPALTDAVLTLSGSSGTNGWEWPDFAWRYLRFAYTANGATAGTITIYTFAKRND